MSNETREHLSCLMDGEISRETGRFLVRRLSADGELRATWARYHLMRDCLRHQEGGFASGDFSCRVRQALEGEPAGPVRIRVKRGWLKPAAGLAIAASVALMAILTVDPAQMGDSGDSGPVVESTQPESFVSPQSLTRAPVSRQASLSGGFVDGDRRMNSYLLRHYQASGATDGRGFVTFVPIVITRSATPAEEEAARETAAETGEAPTGRDGEAEAQ